MPVYGSPIVAAFHRAAALRAQQQSQSSDSASEAVNPKSQTSSNPQDPSLPNNANDEHVDGKRSVQHDLTLSQRLSVCKWMAQTVMSSPYGTRHIASKAVKTFPHGFRSRPNANIQKATRIWRDLPTYLKMESRDKSRIDLGCRTICRNTSSSFKKLSLKAMKGRGRKLAEWKVEFYKDWRDEFDRLRKLGVKFNFRTLQALGKHIVMTSVNPKYSANMIDEASGKAVIDLIGPRFVQSFADAHRIRSRAHTGKRKLSPAKELQIEKEVAFHLGELARMLRGKVIDENNIENADETHFVINMDNGFTLGFSGDEEVKYADVVSGGEGMTMLVRLSGGRDAKIEPVFMVFKNKDRNYPIRGVPDDVAGVAYRTGPKGWIDTTVFPEFLKEKKVMWKLPNDEKRILFLDNCSGHNETMEQDTALQTINTEIRFFPPNSTHLVQPCDSFVIQKIKTEWKTLWDEYKMKEIMNSSWTDGSGRIKNPGKHFFLKLAKQAVDRVNNQRDENGINYARKAMIQCGSALNTNGFWEEAQLTPALQKIIKKHRNHFEGEPVPNE